MVEIRTDFPARLTPNAEVFVGEAHSPLTIRRRREHNDGLLLAFEEYTTPEQVGRFRNQSLYILRRNASKLPKGEFYHYQLIGMEVEADTGETLGTITDIIQTGANDVYEVTNQNGRELLLPAIAEVILDVDPDQKKMRVHLLAGLLDEESEAGS